MLVRKKPVEVEAWKVSDLNSGSIPNDNWPESIRQAFDTGILSFGNVSMHVQTLEGMMLAPPTWWIIRGVNGEFYPCDPDVFDKTYEILD